jgi:metal-responsive CopG/Arc/MetJ family transcriptional regulator
MKTVQMTLDEHLLQAVDQEAQRSSETRSAFIRTALQAELKRRQNEALEAIHRASFLETPDDDVWNPSNRAWGEG